MELENRIFRHNCIFRHAYMYKQPMLTKQKNYNIFEPILHSYLRYTDTLLVVFSLLLAVIPKVHEKPRRKDCYTEKTI